MFVCSIVFPVCPKEIHDSMFGYIIIILTLIAEGHEVLEIYVQNVYQMIKDTEYIFM